jgi:hypothetical protein
MRSATQAIDALRSCTHALANSTHRDASDVFGLRRSGFETMPLTCYYGGGDGIRIRDPHLGKMVILVWRFHANPPPCGSVHLVSTPSTQSVAVVERSTNGLCLTEDRMERVDHQVGSIHSNLLGKA